jgi:hypothetical protein
VVVVVVVCMCGAIHELLASIVLVIHELLASIVLVELRFAGVYRTRLSHAPSAFLGRGGNRHSCWNEAKSQPVMWHKSVGARKFNIWQPQKIYVCCTSDAV